MVITGAPPPPVPSTVPSGYSTRSGRRRTAALNRTSAALPATCALIPAGGRRRRATPARRSRPAPVAPGRRRMCFPGVNGPRVRVPCDDGSVYAGSVMVTETASCDGWCGTFDDGQPACPELWCPASGSAAPERSGASGTASAAARMLPPWRPRRRAVHGGDEGLLPVPLQHHGTASFPPGSGSFIR